MASTWDLTRAPADGDTVIIKANETVTVTSTIITRNDLLVIVRGNLQFSGLVGGLWLNGTSMVVVEADGEINADGWLTDFINVGGGTTEWWGSEGDISGPAYAAEEISPKDPTEGGGVLPPSYSTTLPIELLSFTAQIEGDQILISWASATETNNDFYTIERSTDGINWEIIGEAAGAGTSKEQIDYMYHDSNPIPGISYYKLKQTDYDGQFEYFNPAVVLYEPEYLFKVYPNPATDILQISTSTDLTEATIQIKDANGQVVNVASDASSHQANVYISTLQRGVYILELVFAHSKLSKRIIKN